MKYFAHVDFFKNVKGNASVFISKQLVPSVQDQLIACMYDSMDVLHRGKTIKFIECSDVCSYVCKVTHLKHWHKKVRATLGIKRNGTYDWPVAEIINNLKVKDVRCFPKIVGYGYQKNSYGFICNVVLLTEYVDHSVNVLEFIKRRPDDIFMALDVCFALIKKHIYDGFLHLDLWMGNVLLSNDLSSSWLIDIEYLRFNSRARLEDQLGFCLGYFYKHTLSSHLTNAEYFNYAHGWCLQNIDGLDLELVRQKTAFAGLNDIRRRKRFEMF